MTVGIAALSQYQPRSAGGELLMPEPVIILASDRMLTSGVMQYQQENQTKSYSLNNTIMILISGYGDELLEIIWRTKLEFDRRSMTNVGEAANLLADKFLEYRNYRNERRVLARFGLDMDKFLARQKDFDPNFLRQREAELDDPDYDVGTAILTGIDDTGANIYTVTDPGIARSCGQVGFAAIGTGAEFANPFFMSVGYTRYFEWTRALTLTFAAKKKAEAAAGVGKATDLWWITKEGTIAFGPQDTFLNNMDHIYEARVLKDQIALQEDHIELLKLLEVTRGAPETETPGGQGQVGADEQGELPESPEEGQPES